MKIYTIILFLNSLFLFFNLQAQVINKEVIIIKKTFKTGEEKPSLQFTGNNTNEIQILFSGLFLFYKKFISSQDGASCAFNPSCSEYGLEAIKKQGLLFGILNTFDRLTRCNGLSAEKYQLNSETRLLYDPL